MDYLSTEQQQALAQLREITNGADDDVAIGVLSSVDWDVHRAAELIFGTTAVPDRVIDTFQVDDTHQNVPERQPSTSILATLTRPVFSFLAFPFHVLSNVFRFIFAILRIPFPSLRFTSLSFYRPLRPRPTFRRGPDSWLRELEEETGAVSIGRLKPPRGTTSSIGLDAGPSSLTSRAAVNNSGSGNGVTEDGRKVLPDFVLRSYEETLRMCQRDAMIACIVLVSEEHDDVAEFKRSTLTDTAFVKSLYDNGIVVWGGDVRDQDAWAAAEKLQATTYPFVAFIALQPGRTPSSSSSLRTSAPPTLTVLSRHQGRSVPSSAPTSAQTLLNHLEQQVLPRVSPFLERLRATQRERDRDRQLRQDQDRAFRDSAQRDKERIEAAIRAESAQQQARIQAEEEERERRRQAEVERQKEVVRMGWRRWTRRAFASEQRKSGNLRVAIRLPSGGRFVHQFEGSATLTTLYALVDAQLIPGEFQSRDDPFSPPDLDGVEGGRLALLEAQVESYQSPTTYWGFLIVLAYPRVEIPWRKGVLLGTIEQLRGGGQVVVELTQSGLAGSRRSSSERVSSSSVDGGYSTEDSE